MKSIVVLSVLFGLSMGQGYQGDPRTAAIIAEQRYLGGDGRFGSTYTQEDGVNFKEESEPDGTRRGSYSYVDPNGKRHTINYTAGKNGFQATGDGVPQPIPTTLPVAPQPEYQPLPQYNPPDYRPPQPKYTAQPQYQPQPQYRPQAQYQQQQQQQPQYQPQYSQSEQPQYQPQSQYRPQSYTTTTPAPHRFYPPGKLSLNRSPDGFSYTFNKA